MRQFKLREEKSFIKILKEPPLEKKKVNWSRRVYLSIFLLLASLVVRRAYNANMIIQANGQIDLPKQTVKFPNDIKILEVNTVEGAEVCQGDTLFRYQIMGDQIAEAKLSLRESTDADWIIKEQLHLTKKIQINKVLITQKAQQVNYLTMVEKQKEALVIGGVHAEYSSYSQVLSQKFKVESDMELLKAESDVLRRHLGVLNRQMKIHATASQGELGIYHEVKDFVSPIDGVVSDIFHTVNEICYKKEEMVTIHQMKGATINTYFDPTEVQHLGVGDIVEIEFPDHTISRGIISKFYVSTYAVPSEFQKKYEPTERNIVAEVSPLDKADERAWNSFYKMEVKVQKLRYNLLAFIGRCNSRVRL